MPSATVLHVDDSREQRELVRRAFARSAGDVAYRGTASGLEALELLRGELAGARLLLLLDLHMPGMSGTELLAAIGQQGLRGRWPVVMLTSSEADEDRQQCLDLGAMRYCLKPRDLNGLIQLARELAELLRGQVAPS